MIKPRDVIQQDYYKVYDQQHINYQIFPEDYFTGCDVRIYFGDVWVDEIVSIQFAMQEQLAPIYSFVSYTYDVMARGNRIIRGSFRINFKESLYLKMIANEASYDKTKPRTRAPFIYETTAMENTIEGVLSKTKDLTKSEFDKMANAYEEALWAKGQRDVASQKRLSKDNEPYFRPNHGNFNILITYGPMAERLKYNSTEGDDTIVTMTGVQLGDVSQVISPSGEPIYEDYTFMAKDFNANIRR